MKDQAEFFSKALGAGGSVSGLDDAERGPRRLRHEPEGWSPPATSWNGGGMGAGDDRPPANKWEAEWLQRWPGNGVAVFSSGDRIAVSHSLSEPRNRDLLRDVHESSLIAVIRLKKKGYSDLSVENAQPYGIP
jgi:hypothetical protein